MTTQQTTVERARQELLALSALIRRPPLDDVQLRMGVALTVADAIDTLFAQPEAPTPSPELTARMVAFVREIAGHRGPDRMQSQWQCKAHAIAAELEPVDGDLQRARQIVCDNVPSWTDDHRRACMRGEYDGNLFVVIARRALAEAGK